MLNGRIVCLDLGLKRIGVAASDLLGITAQSVGVISAGSFESNLSEVKKILAERQAVKLIIGYPLNMDGTEGNKAAAIRHEYEAYKEALDIDVELWDERLSTKEAQRALDEGSLSKKKQRGLIDTMAAQIILQSYLDTNKF